MKMNDQILALRQQALDKKAEEEKKQAQVLADQKQKEAENWQQVVVQIKTLCPYLDEVEIELASPADLIAADAVIRFDNCLPIYVLLDKSWNGVNWEYRLRESDVHFCVRCNGQVDYFNDNIGEAIIAAEQYYKEI